MDREKRRLFALGWLFTLHILADVTVALYRCHDIAAWVTDPLAAALSISQICLLTIWLIVGREPISWRISALLAGVCLLLTVYTRLLFPGLIKPSEGIAWFQIEWWYFFRPSGPGDTLVKLPGLLAAISAPLLAWRIARWKMLRRGKVDSSPPWWKFQFRFFDLFVWMAALSVTLSALMTTPPYHGWMSELLAKLIAKWQTAWQFRDTTTFAAVVYAQIALVALWMVFRRQTSGLLTSLLAGIIIFCAVVLDGWTRITSNTGGPADTVVVVLVMALVYSSLLLMRTYDGPLRELPLHAGRRWLLEMTDGS